MNLPEPIPWVKTSGHPAQSCLNQKTETFPKFVSTYLCVQNFGSITFCKITIFLEKKSFEIKLEIKNLYLLLYGKGYKMRH